MYFSQHLYTWVVFLNPMHKKRTEVQMVVNVETLLCEPWASKPGFSYNCSEKGAEPWGSFRSQRIQKQGKVKCFNILKSYYPIIEENATLFSYVSIFHFQLAIVGLHKLFIL